VLEPIHDSQALVQPRALNCLLDSWHKGRIAVTTHALSSHCKNHRTSTGPRSIRSYLKSPDDFGSCSAYQRRAHSFPVWEASGDVISFAGQADRSGPC